MIISRKRFGQVAGQLKNGFCQRQLLSLLWLSVLIVPAGATEKSMAPDLAAIKFTNFLETSNLVFAPKEKILIFIETVPSESSVNYRWRSSMGADPAPVEGDSSRAYWEAPVREGDYRITVTAFDQRQDLQKSHFFNIRISSTKKIESKIEPSIAQK